MVTHKDCVIYFSAGNLLTKKYSLADKLAPPPAYPGKKKSPFEKDDPSQVLDPVSVGRLTFLGWLGNLVC